MGEHRLRGLNQADWDPKKESVANAFVWVRVKDARRSHEGILLVCVIVTRSQ